MADQVIGITIKGIGDFSDVVSNVNNVQRALGKLKLPDKLGDNLNKKLSAFHGEYDKYQKKISEGIKTQGDYNQVEKSLNRMRSLYQEIGQDISKITKLDTKSLLNLDIGEFKQLRNEISNIEKEINKIQVGKINADSVKTPMDALRNSLKGKKFSEKDSGLLDQLIGNVKSGKIEEAKAVFNELEAAVKKITPPKDANGNFIEKVVGKLNPGNAEAATEAIGQLKQILSSTDEEVNPLTQALDLLQKKFLETKNNAKGEILGGANKFKETQNSVEKVTDSLKRMHQEEFSFSRQVQDIDRQIQSYFGLAQIIRKVGDIARSAFNTVKELDASMTETAVVTNFDVGDMWEMLPTYTEQANQLGSTIKDVYDAATLYYQQGLNQTQAMGLANETLKMARIAGMDAAEATDMMTSALRGFNMEINQTSAQKINDIYSQLAAVTASDTREIGTAMEKTASLASSANMKIETTSAFLAQMIETTREAPENLGTAMKTIIARFQEMKQDPTKLIDSEGQAMDVNKIDTALKSIGVALTNTKGEFRDLDDVFLDISAKWDSLTQGQQRYIATTAAGSRQQSRFIAMMSNYDRTMELVDEANNSAGASQKQFEKTLDSMSTKLNQLKNAWDQFTMGLMNNQILKTGVSALTGFFTAVNKIIDVLGSIPPDPFKGITKSLLTLGATLAGLNFAKKFASGSVAAGVGWWKNEGTFSKNFQKGYGVQKNINYEAQSKALLQQKIENRLSKEAISANTVSVPVTVDTYLENIDAESLNQEVSNRIKTVLDDNDTIANKRVRINTILEDAKGKGVISEEQFKRTKITATKNDNALGTVKGVDNLTQKTGKFTTGLTQMGVVLQQVGSQLGPFGGLLSTVGSVMVTLGTTLGAVSAAFLENFASAQAAALGEQVAAAEAMGLTAAEASSAAATLTLSNSFKVLATSIWSTMGPFLAIAAAIGAIVIAYKLLDAAIETDKEKLEKASEAANAASDAYSSAKQNMSELTDTLETIQSNEDAFKGLVAGTAAFNEKLVETNQTISELLEKYPKLNDPKFLSTDKNGLKHINQEGTDYIKKEQARIVGNAAALNVLQKAELKAEEDRQKAEKIRRDSLLKSADELSKSQGVTGGYTYQKLDESNKRITPEINKADEKRAKLLEQEANNAERVARVQALSNSLTNVEVGRREKIAGIWEGTYETALKQAETEAKNVKLDEKYQAYADYLGYKYDASTKKIIDKDNQEVSVDKSTIEDAFPEITVLTNFNADSSSLDAMIDTIDQKFSQGLGESFKDSSNLLSDILNNNIEVDPDALKTIVSDPEKLQQAVGKLTNEQIGALMRVSAEEVVKAPDKYKTDLSEWIKNDAQAALDTQKQTYEDLGAMLATSKFDTSKLTDAQNSQIASILDTLTSQQVNKLTTIGKKLDESVGPDAMETFLSQASDIYTSQDDKLIKSFDSAIDGINWESPTSRLEAYTKLANSNNDTLKNMAQIMRDMSSEANLLGDAFDEFLGGEWAELQENADEFRNSLGEIDGAGILKASEQSKTLKAMLDSGEVSASGLAVALNGVESGSFFSINESMLKLLSSINRLKDAALEAHNIIENFDAGIDTGEGEDFIKENAEAVQKYMDNNEWGNEQLQNYIKLAAGEERWNEVLNDKKGNLKETTKALDQYVTKFKDGFQAAYDDIMSDKGINGKSLTDNINNAIEKGDIKESLGKKFKDLEVDWDENGFMQWDFGDMTTDELETYFQKAYGVSEQYAKLFLQDILNYNETEATKLAANDLKASVNTKDFRESHFNNEGEIVLSNEEIEMLKSIPGGQDALVELASAARMSVKELESHALKVSEDGKAVTKYKKLFNEYQNKIFNGEKLYKQEQLLDENGRLDTSKVEVDAKQRGLNDEQSIRMAFRAYKEARADGKETSYNGQKLSDNLNLEQFKEEVNSITESGQWITVGQTIGDQIVNAMTKIPWSELIKGSEENDQTKSTPPSKPELFGPGITFGINNINDSGLQAVYDKVKLETGDTSGKNIADAITAHLAEHKQELASLNENQQRDAINGLVSKMNEWKISPEDMTRAINEGLGTHFKEGDLTGKLGKITIDQSALQQQLANTNFTINATVKVTDLQTKSSGQNNPNSAFHRVGTMARGSRSGYTIPGRPTLTGEEGEELVWEPKRNEAYMVGSNGPQFANISRNAVVWNADQTRRIKKNSGSVGRFGTGSRGITPFGTMAFAKGSGAGGGNKTGGSLSWPTPIDLMGNITDIIPPKEEQKIPVTAELRFKEDKKNPAQEKKEEKQTVTNSITLNSSISNPNEPKEKIKKVLPNPYQGTIKASFALSSSVSTGNLKSKIQSGANKAAKGVKIKASTTSTVKTDADTSTAQKKIDSIKRTKPPVEIKTRAITSTAQSAINSISGKSVEVTITPNFKGTWKKEVVITKKTKPHTGGLIAPGGGVIYRARGGLASNPMFKREGTDTIPAMLTPGEYVHNRDAVNYFGVDFMRRINHKDLGGALQSFGSSANGRYGIIGPKDKGGLTLTGEKGYEIAWLPSENRSMILGVDGPQMINLPDDAVIYTHEQSKDILKRKSINAGSHGGRTNPKRSGDSKSDGGGKGGSGKSGSGKGNGKGDNGKGGDKKDRSNTKETKKIIDKAGKLSVWWENQTRKVDAVQRQVDKTAKAFDKSVSQFGATFNSIGKDLNAYINRLYKSISLNKESQKKANNALKSADKNTAKSKSERNKANKEVKAAQKAYNKDKKSKKAKEKLDKAKKKQDKAYGRTTAISWDVTEVTTKKGKKSKKTVKKKENINLSKYISYDSDLDVYTVDQNQLNKIKSKNKKKAINEAAKKKIDDNQSKKNTAEDNIIKTQEALDTVGKKIYDTFLGWEVELTKIWNITQKISNIESKINRLKEYTSLQEAQLGSGLEKATAEFTQKSLKAFSAQMKLINDSLTERLKLIKEQQNSLKELFTGESIRSTLKNVNNKLVKDTDAKNKYNKAVKNPKDQIKKSTKRINKYNELISKKEEKKATAKKKIKEIKNNNKLSKKDQKKKINKQKKEIKNANKKINTYQNKKTAEQNKKNAAKNKVKKATNQYNAGTGKYKERLSNAEKLRYKQEQKELKNQEKLRYTALKYLNYSANGDGTYNISFNTAAFKRDRENLGITSDTAAKIQEYVKKIQEENSDLNDTYTDVTPNLTELYTTLSDLKEEQADNADELQEIAENQQQKEIEKIRSLNESLNESVRDLLDEVKQRLAERRNREDNLKTEQDISQKQQRLAALRADTSSGNAVEIAQLEKEIAEAQQTYGRTLEDQLLDKLQKQADDAAKQRDRMIELQEAAIESASEQSNVAKVNEWMSLIEKNSMGIISNEDMASIWEEIKAQYLSNKDYDSQNYKRQEVILNEWEQFKASLLGNYGKQEATKKEIATANNKLTELNTSINNLIKTIDNSPKTVDGEETYNKKVYSDKIKSAASNKKIGKDELISVKNAANKAGFTAGKYLADLAATEGLTWKQVLTAAKQAGYNKERLAATFSGKNFEDAFNAVYGKGAYAKANKAKAKKYATGGLSTQTGPAWLDGTPTKPELVLNPTDTKNFLALKDVLSDVMGSINSTDNSYKSNDVYNININVNKLANDYDVDKMVSRVKSEITKSAGYRNVTQARSFR